MAKQAVIIIGAGPAGLTAAAELLERTDIRPVVLEASPHLGGLSRTVNHNGNRMDIGGHRFFSKSDRVMEWWFRRLPLQATADSENTVFYQGRSRNLRGPLQAPDPAATDRVMLIRPRSSRIYYRERFFDYPLQLGLPTLLKLGLLRSFMMLASYIRWKLFPPRRIENLEEFFISRFGRSLYETFFKSYTEKVWGVPCTQLSAEWGAQRIKTLSVSRAIGHALKRLFRSSSGDRKNVETSLIEQFLYPKFGPGQMWETVAAEVEAQGGEIRRGMKAVGLLREGNRIFAVVAESTTTGEQTILPADLVLSTMPIKDLCRALRPAPDPEVGEVAEGLVYRDFITVGLLLSRLKIGTVGDAGTVRDNWIYIHEPKVDVGRLQIFNNWSPWMVRDASDAWIGLEYFCDEGDRLWAQTDAELIAQAVRELRIIGLLGEDAPKDAVVVRAPKAYPAYRGSYSRFGELRSWLDAIENLHLIGRNGMHRYNNQDHSMLAAMTAVDNILSGTRDRSNLWEINSEEDYHETRAARCKVDTLTAGTPGQARRGGDFFLDTANGRGHSGASEPGIQGGSVKRPKMSVMAAAAVGLTLATLFVFRISASSAGVGAASDLIPEHRLEARREQVVRGTPETPDGPLDLLNLIDVRKDALVEGSGFHGRALLTSPQPYARIQVPVRPPEEYDLDLEVTRKRGNESLILGFVHQGRRGAMLIDARDGSRCRIQLSGHEDQTAGESAETKRLLPWNTLKRLRISVRKTGVSVAVDKTVVLEWNGDPIHLEERPGYQTVDPTALFLGTWESVFRIETWILTPVQGLPVRLR